MQEAETRHGQRVSESSEGMMSIQQRCKVCLMYWMICGSPRLFSAVSHQREHELIFLSLRAGCSAKTLMSSNKKLETRNYHLPCESKMAISPPRESLGKETLSVVAWSINESPATCKDWISWASPLQAHVCPGLGVGHLISIHTKPFLFWQVP